MIGILILINKNVSEFPLIISTNLFMLLQKFYGFKNDIIKIKRVVFF